MTSAERQGGGVALVIAACACFATLDIGSKVVSATVPMMLVLWIRYVMQMVFIGAVLVPRSGGAPFATRHPLLQVVRGLLLMVCSMLAFLSLKHMPVGEFTAIVMISRPMKRAMQISRSVKPVWRDMAPESSTARRREETGISRRAARAAATVDHAPARCY